MKLAKNIITALLALLLANPACCCAFGSCGSASESAPAQSCCSASSDDENTNEDLPDRDHKCQCSLNKQYTGQAKFDLVSPAAIPLLEPIYIELVKVPYEPLLVDMPDLSAHPPPSSPIRILFSVFRL